MEDTEPKSRVDLFLAKKSGQEVDLPKPVSRIDLFLAKWNGQDVTLPSDIISREEDYYSHLINANYDDVLDPVNREEFYLAKLLNKDVDLPKPVSRKDYYLYEIFNNSYDFYYCVGSFTSRTTANEQVIVNGSIAEIQQIEGKTLIVDNSMVNSKITKLISSNIDETKQYILELNLELGSWEDVYKNINIFTNENNFLGYIASNGTLGSSAISITSDFIPIDDEETYTLKTFGTSSLAARAFCFYDKDKTYMSGNTWNSLTTDFVTPIGAKYLRVCFPKATDNMVFQGNANISNYIPHVEGILLKDSYFTERDYQDDDTNDDSMITDGLKTRVKLNTHTYTSIDKCITYIAHNQGTETIVNDNAQQVSVSSITIKYAKKIS